MARAAAPMFSGLCVRTSTRRSRSSSVPRLFAKWNSVPCRRGRSFELLSHPLLQRVHVLRATQEVLYQIVGRHGPAGLKHQVPITSRGWTCQQIGLIELRKEIFGNHLVPHVSVISRRVAREMPERRIHMRVRSRHGVAVFLDCFASDLVRIDIGGIAFVQVVGDRCETILPRDTDSAAKSRSAIHLGDEFRGYGLSGLIVTRKPR